MKRQIEVLAKKVTGIRESAAKHHLLKRGARFTTDDIEDIVNDAWLVQHCEETLIALLDREGLSHTPKNYEYAHQLIDHELSEAEAAKDAHRVAQRWIDSRKRLHEVSMKKVESADGDGGELLLEEALGAAEVAVTDRNGAVLNDRCTPRQHLTEQDWIIYQSPEDKAKIAEAMQRLKPGQLEWLQNYEDTKGTNGTHSAADRQKAMRLRRKARGA